MKNSGKIVRNIQGSSIKLAKKIQLTATEKDLSFISSKKVIMQGKDSGLVLNDFVPDKNAKPKLLYKISKIKCDTPLDEGSANDNTRVNTQKGLVFGKTYHFKVIKYASKEPEDKRLIHWQLKYHSPETSQNKWVIKKFKTKGESISIFMNDKDMCGRFVSVSAYISNAETEGTVKLWLHNRFKFFDSKVFYKQLEIRINKPSLINQSETQLCGMACIYYLLAKYNSKNYKKLATEVFRTGSYKLNNYTVELSGRNQEIYDRNPYTDSKHPRIDDIDWLTLAVTRIKESNIGYSGEIDQDFSSITWPNIMTSLIKNLLGYKDVSTYDFITFPSKYFTGSTESLKYPIMVEGKVKEINEQIKNGYKLFLLIDSDLISDDGDNLISSFEEPHWVVLEKPIEIIDALDSRGRATSNYYFKVYSWGTENRYLEKSVTLEHFRKNYYAYIRVK